MGGPDRLNVSWCTVVSIVSQDRRAKRERRREVAVFGARTLCKDRGCPRSAITSGSDACHLAKAVQRASGGSLVVVAR